MGMFEQVMVGLVGVLILFLFLPGVKAAVKRSREVEKPEWAAALIPLAIVVAFIVFLILLARN